MSAEPMSRVERDLLIATWGLTPGSSDVRWEATVQAAEERAELLRGAIKDALDDLAEARGLTADEPKHLIDGASATLRAALAYHDAASGGR